MRRVFLPVVLISVALMVGCAERPKLNLVVITFDTTRADRLGCYGNENIRTPNVDQLASEGVLFRNAISQIPLTLPSHTTMMTGKVPVSHGIRDNGLFVVNPRELTLAEILSERGWACGAAVGSFPLVSKFGLDQGFEFFDDHLTAEYEDHLGRMRRPKGGLFFDERRAARVNEAVLPWLEENSGNPFFLWVHYFDPHQPLDPPPPYDQLYADNLYDGEIAYADESFGGLLAELRRLGVDDNTVVVFASDHGEGLGEHREQTHSMLLYQGTLHVPLVIRAPGGAAGQIVEDRVGLVDIFPTVLDLLGVEIPGDIQGRSQVAHIAGTGSADEEGREIYAETLSPRLTNGWGELRAIYTGAHKYIHGPRPELFDLEDDPKELRNLVEDEPKLALAMRNRLETVIGEFPTPEWSSSAEIDDETRESLAALGYIHTADTAYEVVEESLRDGGIAPQDRIGDINDVSRAKDMLHNRRPLEAREVLVDLVARNPENASYRELLASAELMLGLVESASENIEVAKKTSPTGSVTDGLVLQMVGELFATGNRDRATVLLEDHLERHPTADGFYFHGLLLKEIGDEGGRILAIRRALELNQGHAGARIDLAIELAQTGHRDQAEREFTRAIEDARYFARAHHNYGTFLYEGGEVERAAERFERAVDLQPDYLKAHLALVAVRLELGDRVAAERALKILTEIAPSSPEAGHATDLVEGSS